MQEQVMSVKAALVEVEDCKFKTEENLGFVELESNV